MIRGCLISITALFVFGLVCMIVVGTIRPGGSRTSSAAASPSSSRYIPFGEKCILKKGALIAPTIQGLDQAIKMLVENDMQALNRLGEQKIVGVTEKEAVVIPEHFHGWLADTIEIRLVGSPETLFTKDWFIDADPNHLKQLVDGASPSPGKKPAKHR
jgi:hypothetical protein